MARRKLILKTTFKNYFQGEVTCKLSKEGNTSDGGYHIFECDDDAIGRTVVQYRNVGNKNEGSSIQFEIEQWSNLRREWTKSSFHIPLSMAEIFINSLKQ